MVLSMNHLMETEVDVHHPSLHVLNVRLFLLLFLGHGRHVDFPLMVRDVEMPGFCFLWKRKNTIYIYLPAVPCRRQ